MVRIRKDLLVVVVVETVLVVRQRLVLVVQELLLLDTQSDKGKVMAHFAEIDSTNKVLRVIVVADEHEADGANWCHNLLGGTWVQTSYTNRIRKQYAGIGFAYDAVKDQFVAPQPYASWSLDANNDWQAPTPKPEGDYMWDEETLAWVEAPVG